MFDPNNPAMGQMNIMGALGGQGTMPVMPQRPMMDHAAMQALRGDHSAMRDFKQDFRDQRNEWRGDMHQYHDAMRGFQGHGQQQPGPITNPGVQGPPVPNMQPPVPGFAAPGVGQSLNVQGMIPAASGYGLPTY